MKILWLNQLHLGLAILDPLKYHLHFLLAYPKFLFLVHRMETNLSVSNSMHKDVFDLYCFSGSVLKYMPLWPSFLKTGFGFHKLEILHCKYLIFGSSYWDIPVWSFCNWLKLKSSLINYQYRKHTFACSMFLFPISSFTLWKFVVIYNSCNL